jgi:hypothetical protein
MTAAPFLSDFPTRFDGPIPQFTAEGSLPPGDFQPSRREFEERFVEAGERAQRAAIYRGWNSHRRELVRAGLAETSRQLLNESYTSAKDSPADVDIAVEVPVSRSGQIASFTSDHPIGRLLMGPQMKAEYHCDAYPIYTLPKGDPHYASVTVRAIEYWTKWFGRDRAGTAKGRVWATTGGLG